MSNDYDPGDYNRTGMLTFMVSMVATMGFFVYVSFIHAGVDLKEIPTEKPAAEKSAETEAPAEGASEEE